MDQKSFRSSDKLGLEGESLAQLSELVFAKRQANSCLAPPTLPSIKRALPFDNVVLSFRSNAAFLMKTLPRSQAKTSKGDISKRYCTGRTDCLSRRGAVVAFRGREG